MIIRYAWVSKQLVGFFFVVLSLAVGVAQAETASPDGGEKKLLRPKNTVRSPDSESPAPPRLRPKRPGGNNDERNLSRRPASLDYNGISLMLQTPLGREDRFSGRFSTVGITALASIELTTFSSGAVPLHLETGLAADLSRLELTQPSVSFSRIAFQLPLRLRLLFPLEADLKLAAEAYLGARVRIGYHDSRTNADGGFHFFSELGSNIIPDAAIGILYRIADGTRLRFSAGYLYLAGGVEFQI